MLGKSVGVPERFKDCTLDDFKDTSGLKQRIGEYIDNIKEERSAYKGLLLVGPPGIGKTMLACIVLNAAAQADPKCHTHYIELAKYQRLLMRIAEINRRLERVNRPQFEAEYAASTLELYKLDNLHTRILSEAQVLVIDDVGKEYTTGSGFVESEFDYLVRQRDNNGFITIMTSNLPPDRWADAYSESMRSFIYQICHIVDVRGQDYRRQLPRRV